MNSFIKYIHTLQDNFEQIVKYKDILNVIYQLGGH